jgi:hypothetical protein
MKLGSLFLNGLLLILLASILLSSCSGNSGSLNKELESKMNNISENYVKLVLKIGELDSDYVDAYYGPKDWQPHDNLKTPEDSTALRNFCNAETDSLLNALDALKNFKANEIETLRYRFLYKQLLAVKAKVFMLGGGTFSFDEESKALYDAVAPTYTKEHFQNIIDELSNILPGNGNVDNRLEEYRKSFIIPKEKLDTVFNAAIAECKKKTLDYIKLPANENFKLEYVTNKPWSGYNWYKGNYFSEIQINTDMPIYIDRAIDLAAHEGYPGHHVYNTLLEENLVKKNGWMEFTVYPLFSPQSLIAEGTANFGIDMIFPGNSRVEFEKNILFPLAGLNPKDADKYYEVLKLVDELRYSGNEAARNYLDGKWNESETIDWLMKYSLMSKDKAVQRLKFIEKYRSYVINYNLGQDLIKNYIEHNGGANNQAKRWSLFTKLLSTPQTPSGLK